jgi:hypothetical protein
MGGKQLKKAKKEGLNFFKSLFGDEAPFIPLESAKDMTQFFMSLSNIKPKEIHWRECRPRMLADEYQFTPSPTPTTTPTEVDLTQHSQISDGRASC